MAIADDFLIDYANRRIYNVGTTVYTVNALYSYLQDTFDELIQLDDAVPMSAQTPTEYTLINGWYIDDESIKFLTGGAIQSSGWINEIHILNFGATYTNAVPSDIGKPVLDDGGAFGILIAYDNTLKKWSVRTGSATTAASGSAITITGGTGAGTTNVVSATGEALFTNVFTLGSIEAGTQIYIEQNNAKVVPWWLTGHIDILLKVKESGVLIDGALVSIFAQEYTDLYDHFDINLTAGGRQAVPLATSNDLNNQTAVGTIANFQNGVTATIAITFGTFTADIDGNAVNETYSVRIDCNGQRLDKVYEVCKYWTRRGSTTTLNGEPGDLYVAANPSYTPVKQSPLGTFAGGKFFGARGVYLINLHPSDIQAYQLIDNANNTIVPPNFIPVGVSGLVAGDRVAVFPSAAGVVNKSQYNLTVTASGAHSITVGTTLPIDTPSSGSIVLRAVDEKREYTHRYNSYSGSTLTFPVHISSTATAGDTDTLIDGSANFITADLEVGDIIHDTTNNQVAYVLSIDSATQLTTTVKATAWSGANYVTNSTVQAVDTLDTAYIPYLLVTADSAAEVQTIIYFADRSVITRVRKKGILPFEVAGTITATGLSVTAIRTTDSIVT